MHVYLRYNCSMHDYGISVSAPLLLYECTTEIGSSGSPVLKEVDGDLKIVALHRGGKDKQWDCGGYNCETLI